MGKDEPPCSSLSQQKLCGHSLKSHRDMQQHFILNQPEGGAKFKLKSCIKNLYGHSESEFLFNIFQLVSLWVWGFVLHQCGWVTLVRARKRCKHSRVPELLKVCQNLFPMDVEVNIQQGKELCVLSYRQLQLMLPFTLCEVAEWSLVTKNLQQFLQGLMEIKNLTSKIKDETKEFCCSMVIQPSRDAQSFLPSLVTFYCCALGYINGHLTIPALTYYL